MHPLVDVNRIARNAGWLYLRHLLMMVPEVIALGIVTKALGIEGFGLFAAVSGVATLICFCGGSLGESFRKYISRVWGSDCDVREAFAAALGLTAAVAFVAFALAESLGLVFVLKALSVPSGWRTVLCYECAVGVSLVGLVRVPFESFIYSHERMGWFVVAGAIEGALTLFVAALVAYSPPEVRLTRYAVLMWGVAAVHLLVFVALVRGSGKVRLRLSFAFRSRVFREMSEFFLCGLFRSFSSELKYRGTGLLVNLYAGVAFSATWRLAMKVGSALYVLVGNLNLAYTPQMLRLHAAEDRGRLVGMVVRTGLVSFAVMSAAAIPVMVFADGIVRLWVGTPPPQAAAFIRALAIHFLFDSLTAPLHFGITTISNAPRYQVVVSLVMGSGFLLAFAALAAGLPAWFAPAGVAAANALSFVYRVVVFRSMVGLKENRR